MALASFRIVRLERWWRNPYVHNDLGAATTDITAAMINIFLFWPLLFFLGLLFVGYICTQVYQFLHGCLYGAAWGMVRTYSDRLFVQTYLTVSTTMGCT